MSIHTNPNKAVSLLLKHLAPLEKKTNLDLDDLKSELMKIKDLFSIVKRNEDELLDTLTTVYKYLHDSNIDKLMEEKERICERIQDSARKLLPASPSKMKAIESSGKTSQRPQMGETVHEKLYVSYQIQGLEDFMGRGDIIFEYKKCMLNPWIRDKWVEQLVFQENGQGQLYERYSLVTPSRIPYLALDQKKVKLGGGLDYKSDHWRVILNIGASYLNFGPKWMAKMKNLEMLHLGRWKDSSSLHIEVETEDFLKELWDQKHLRYLNLRGISRIFVIPSSITKLESLEVLDLKACHNLETLPDISSLINLVYLNMSQCYLLESMPKGIEKLIKLKVLKGFVIGSANKTHGRLARLANLNFLRKLSIHIVSNATMDVEFEYLKIFPGLRNLKISWGTFERYNNRFGFDAFVPTFMLEKLTLEGFPEENINREWFTIASRTKNELYIFLKRSIGKRNDVFVKEVLNQIRDVAHKVEDVLDIYIANVTRQRQRNILNKLFHLEDYAVLLHEVDAEIEKIKSSIDDIYKNKERYGIYSNYDICSPSLVRYLTFQLL
ncbi:hypothetical protein RJT34_18548 [Clitoria ternatea]|uniref:Disease resistance R13L4/SHOC-2-like LRR domain-containing protein n=1 Tax=Clitoria ternatea TaxID=43366 RepID=A0AAN9PFY7_CLITE